MRLMTNVANTVLKRQTATYHHVFASEYDPEAE